MSDTTRPFGQMTRRHWLGHLASTALGVPAIQFFSSLEAGAQQLRKANRSCIVLWMGGGPSHLDIWDLKPDSEKNGGPFRPIPLGLAPVVGNQGSQAGRGALAGGIPGENPVRGPRIFPKLHRSYAVVDVCS